MFVFGKGAAGNDGNFITLFACAFRIVHFVLLAAADELAVARMLFIALHSHDSSLHHFGGDDGARERLCLDSFLGHSDLCGTLTGGKGPGDVATQALAFVDVFHTTAGHLETKRAQLLAGFSDGSDGLFCFGHRRGVRNDITQFHD